MVRIAALMCLYAMPNVRHEPAAAGKRSLPEDVRTMEGLGLTRLDEYQDVSWTPKVTIPRAVAPEPECVFDSAQVEALGRILMTVERW
jgi:hypothetical protein